MLPGDAWAGLQREAHPVLATGWKPSQLLSVCPSSPCSHRQPPPLPLSAALSRASSLQSVKTFQCVLQIPCLQPPALSQINHVLGNTAGMY